MSMRDELNKLADRVEMLMTKRHWSPTRNEIAAELRALADRMSGGAVAMPERWGVRRAPGVNAYVLTAPEGDETLVDRPLVVRFLDDLAASHARVAAALAQEPTND